MNTFTMKGNWNEIAGKLKQQFANLTDDDLLFKQGKEEELLGRLQQKTWEDQVRTSQADREDIASTLSVPPGQLVSRKGV